MKLDKEQKKIKKSKDLEVELTKRADEANAKFGFDKEEFFKQLDQINSEVFENEVQITKIF